MQTPIALDPRDPTPLYAQLDRGIRVAIATGRLKPGDQLPTVRQLAVDLRVNANTVAKVFLARGSSISRAAPQGRRSIMIIPVVPNTGRQVPRFDARPNVVAALAFIV